MEFPHPQNYDYIHREALHKQNNHQGASIHTTHKQNYDQGAGYVAGWLAGGDYDQETCHALSWLAGWLGCWLAG